jgi:hypothetical protein
MFCKNKNNKKKTSSFPRTSVTASRTDTKSDYVEIKELAAQFSKLNALAHEINNVEKESENGNSTLFFYQRSIRKSFIEEFERQYKELFSKSISYGEYWKTRSC